ncbi:MAG: alpha-amylase family glycosyl hydrolase [Sphingomonadaceae bacterium]
MKRFLPLLLVTLAAPALAQPAAVPDYRDRLAQDEVMYFVLPDRFENGDPANDRGGFKGDRLKTGFDPASKGFFLGGDLKGLIQRLDYIQGLGATAIWLGPIFKNKPVQGAPGEQSAGYHGYWVTDFTTVDPHFGTDAEMKAFVDAAHARGMKVYMDIIVNHTADVIAYKECPNSSCVYRSRADFPYQRRGGPAGAPINPGFVGDQTMTAENFALVSDMTFAYTPFVPKGEETVKVPAWLNDIKLYHNRGNTTFSNESSTMGDFVGLDDLMTEHPRVVSGMIDIFGGWIDRYGIDGFRVDTARHVNPEMWQQFVPAMIARAKAKGIPNFHIFGEIGGVGLEPGKLAVHTRVDGFPATIDFAFRQAVINTVGGTAGTEDLELLFAQDALYEGGAAAGLIQPTFISNHDNGRFAYFVRQALPKASDAEVLARVKLGHAMMLLLRGVPVIYSGDEQGFAGDGNDQDAREPLFASKVASYLDNRLVGTSATHAQPNFTLDHPLYTEIAKLAKLRQSEPALTRGRQLLRARSPKPGLFAVSRFDPNSGREVVLAFNTGTTALDVNVEIDIKSLDFRTLAGQCAAKASAPATLRLSLPPLSYAVCAAASAQ